MAKADEVVPSAEQLVKVSNQTSPTGVIECSSEPENSPEKIPELMQAQLRSDDGYGSSKNSKDDEINLEQAQTSEDDTFNLRFSELEDCDE